MSVQRQKMWNSIRGLKVFLAAEIAYNTDVRKETAHKYIYTLYQVGILSREEFFIAERKRPTYLYTLKNNIGQEAPIVDHNGKESKPNPQRKNLWRSMKILGKFTAQDLIETASTNIEINRKQVAPFLTALSKAKYLVAPRKGSSVWRFVPSKYTGPLPPVVRKRGKVVYDPNTFKEVYNALETK